MKRLIELFAIIGVFILSGCFDSIEETTIKEDGSGMIADTFDMSKMISMLAAMGGDEKMKDAGKEKIDTTILFKDIKDSLNKLSDAEKKLLEKGSARFLMNIKDEKFSISFSVPFTKVSDINPINYALGKASGKLLMTMMEKITPEEKKGDLNGAEDNIEEKQNQVTPSINSYYGTFYEKNKIFRRLDKEMIAKMSEDESLKSVKEMGQMGIGAMNMKTVINLPKSAKKTEGKGVKLSDDKKTVTIEGTLDDFFEDPSFFEYEIEY